MEGVIGESDPGGMGVGMENPRAHPLYYVDSKNLCSVYMLNFYG